jgi:exosortase F-associated protein
MENVLKKPLAIASLVVLGGLLVGVRYFESWFYDPLAIYFSRDFLAMSLPRLDLWAITLSYAARFTVNAVLSLLIIYVLFASMDRIRFVAACYLVALLILLVGFLLLVRFFEQEKMIIFYVRRFIIQPLLLLLFIPAFLYQDKISSR